jgi:uncharacterized protein
MSGSAAVHRLEDPFAFARVGGLHNGQIAVAALARLQDRLAGNEGTVSYEVRGGLDSRDRPLLTLSIAGALRMQCGRCLARLDFPLQLESRVLLTQAGAAPQHDDDPEAPEWVEAGQELDLLELVEDEILLGLPYSVRHESGPCGDQAGNEGGRKRNSPFSGLAGLLGPEQPNSE